MPVMSGELMLVPWGQRVSIKVLDEDNIVEEVQVMQDGVFIQDEGVKYTGEQRLRLKFSIPRLCQALA